jgi:hypothetical protein
MRSTTFGHGYQSPLLTLRNSGKILARAEFARAKVDVVALAAIRGEKPDPTLGGKPRAITGGEFESDESAGATDTLFPGLATPQPPSVVRDSCEHANGAVRDPSENFGALEEFLDQLRDRKAHPQRATIAAFVIIMRYLGAFQATPHPTHSDGCDLRDQFRRPREGGRDHRQSCRALFGTSMIHG